MLYGNRQSARMGEPFLQGFKVRKSVLAIWSVILVGLGTTAQAAPDNTVQSRDTQSTANPMLEEIIVTGTLIRGIQPTGSQSLEINAETIEISGAKSANEILGTLPQAQNLFNSRAALNPRAQSRETVVRPNLRGLPNFEQASGTATLVLVDGHRIVGMGVAQAAPDPDVVPPSVIERVEIITDGGSSLYGADAVGGVINIITKRDFDGVEIDLGYNTADDYWGYDASITAGTSWDSGSGYISLTRADRDSVLGKDRSWAAQGQWTENGLMPADTECLNPVGTTQTMEYRELVPGVRVWDGRAYEPVAVGSRCDRSALGTIFPKEDRSSVFLGVTQELNEAVTLNVRGYYSERNTTFEGYPRGDTVSFGPQQFSPTPSASVGETRERGSLGFSYGAHPDYQRRDGETNLQTWGITPQLTVDMKGGWQLRNLLHYSRSDNEFFEPGSNTGLLLESIADGTVDPSNIAATDSALLTDILDWELAGESIQELFTARAVADGPVMELPAGDLRMAVGMEYADQSAKLRQGNHSVGGLSGRDFPEESRNVKSFFAEAQIPLISARRGVDSLVLSASVRHDDYSDFGSTTNPHLGLSWDPVYWLNIHANWGESFVAPTLIDTLRANTNLAYNPNSVGIVQPSANRAGVIIGDGRTDTVSMNGAQPDLSPQTAETWAVGFKMSPPVVKGLRVSGNYYEIDFRDLLGGINPQLATGAVLFPERYVWNPTQADLDALAADSLNPEALVGVDPSTLAAILDLRVGNTDQAILKGFDFSVNYTHDTRLGTLSYGVSGTRRHEFELTRAGVTGDELKFGTPKTLAMASVGFIRGNFRSNLSLKYTAGYRVDDGLLGQRSVNDFKTVDLFMGYDFEGAGFLDDLSVRFNVSNLFDEKPPIYRLNNQPAYRGFTLGRMYGFGVTKRFH